MAIPTTADLVAANVAADIRHAVTAFAEAHRKARKEVAEQLKGDESAEWEINLGAVMDAEARWAMYGFIPKYARSSAARSWEQNPDMSDLSDAQVIKGAREARDEALLCLTTGHMDPTTMMGEVWRRCHHDAALRLYNHLKLLSDLKG